MASLAQAKILGGIGSILLLLSLVPRVRVAALIGLALILVAVKYVSDVLVGFVIIFVAEILQTVAFFSIPEEAPQQQQPAL